MILYIQETYLVKKNNFERKYYCFLIDEYAYKLYVIRYL